MSAVVGVLLEDDAFVVVEPPRTILTAAACGCWKRDDLSGPTRTNPVLELLVVENAAEAPAATEERARGQ